MRKLEDASIFSQCTNIFIQMIEKAPRSYLSNKSMYVRVEPTMQVLNNTISHLLFFKNIICSHFIAIVAVITIAFY